jgi:hypothetical protein
MASRPPFAVGIDLAGNDKPVFALYSGRRKSASGRKRKFNAAMGI